MCAEHSGNYNVRVDVAADVQLAFAAERIWDAAWCCALSGAFSVLFSLLLVSAMARGMITAAARVMAMRLRMTISFIMCGSLLSRICE